MQSAEGKLDLFDRVPGARGGNGEVGPVRASIGDVPRAEVAAITAPSCCVKISGKHVPETVKPRLDTPAWASGDVRDKRCTRGTELTLCLTDASGGLVLLGSVS